MEKTSVILDTDIGSDIDDAVALAYLLRQERCDLLGVTTVSGEPHKRASLASAVLAVAGRDDIPVHVGAADPLIVSQHQGEAPQFEALAGRWAHRNYDAQHTAVEFLRNTIRQRPGEVTLLAIGPLTNIALLFKIDPGIPKLLREMVIMGGQFFAGQTAPDSKGEWNIRCDPHAAQIVFDAQLPQLTAIGLDVTLQCVLPADECRKRFNAAGGPLAPVASMAEVWFRHGGGITFHDPLAAAFIFDTGFCRTLTGQIRVDLASPEQSAITLYEPRETGIHHAAASVDPAAFFEHYFGITGG